MRGLLLRDPPRRHDRPRPPLGRPPSHRTLTPLGPQPTHDDRLLSAALIAELDRLPHAGKLALGSAHSAINPSPDPLTHDIY